MKFTKMHGCGNDYVYVNLFEEKIADPAKVSIAVSDRHFGIGSDGLITIGPSDIADFRMRIYNADGSEAEMCGNGIRCVAKYVYAVSYTHLDVYKRQGITWGLECFFWRSMPVHAEMKSIKTAGKRQICV